MMTTLLLSAEFALLFAGVPMLFLLGVLPRNPIPVLLGVTAVAVVVLLQDRHFDRGRLWNAAGVRQYFRYALVRALLLAGVLTAGAAVLMPDELFGFPRGRPVFWMIIIVLYPVFSVYPQELMYRAFFFHRYRRLFGEGNWMVLASALAFGFVHIIFGHWISVVLSTAGGLLFAATYGRSRSLLLTSLEHAFFGDLIFTIGLGQFFYHGAR